MAQKRPESVEEILERIGVDPFKCLLDLIDSKDPQLALRAANIINEYEIPPHLEVQFEEKLRSRGMRRQKNGK